MSLVLEELATSVGAALRNHGCSLVTAESCTGGWIAKSMTDIPGSSAWFERGFVAYSDAAKQELLGVKETTLREHGAVSAETVIEMVVGALRRSQADIAVAVSGVAGPDGGSPAKPVGTVCLGWAWRKKVITRSCQFNGTRETVRAQAVISALQGIVDLLGQDRDERT